MLFFSHLSTAMKFNQYIIAFLLLSTTADTKEQHKPQLQTGPFTIGESITWQSNTLDQSRTINIYLPQGYQKQSQNKYPLIYLLDGSADEDFIHIAGLVQFGSFSWINMLPESIVVGIANVDRKHDMTYPTTDAKDKAEFPTTGGSAKFIQFLKDELQPLITSRYRVTDEKTIIGQSLGGLLATEILFKHPEMFDNYLIVSPSLWWDDGALLKHELSDELKNKTIFVAVGKEGPIMESAAQSLHKKLSGVTTKKLGYQFFEQLDHGDTLHQAAYSGFEFLFKTTRAQPKGS